jgi:protocatechuate 3,4-dioxygenase, beta subunit
MNRIEPDRREFLRLAGAATLFPLFIGCRGSTFAQPNDSELLTKLRANAIQDKDCSWCGARDLPEDVGSHLVLAGKQDNGDRIRISGTVYAGDGKPAPNTLIYLYHTDIYGNYGAKGEHRHGGYRGWMLTEANARYEFESIKPASYPNSTIAAHIHMTVTTVNRKEDWIDSILFEGDRFITQRERESRKGGFDPILKMQKNEDGVLTGVRDIKLG